MALCGGDPVRLLVERKRLTLGYGGWLRYRRLLFILHVVPSIARFISTFARYLLLTEHPFFFFISTDQRLDFRTVPTIAGACKRSDLLLDPRTHYAEPLLNVENTGPQIDHTRSYTSVSLTLRPPSSEPQPPIDIRSQGSSLTYSSSSLDPRGFQSRLQISIGAGAVGGVAAARIRPPMGPIRPNSLIPPVQTGPQRPPGPYFRISVCFRLFHVCRTCSCRLSFQTVQQL